MDDVATFDAGAAVDAQPDATEHESQVAEVKSQPAKAGGMPKAKKAEILAGLLKREKESPDPQFSDSDLDILEEHWDGKLEPAKKTKPRTPEKEEAPISEVEDPEETEASDEEEPEENDQEAEADEEDTQPSAELEAAMKEVGAKSPKELLSKIKALRSSLGGKDAQAVATLKREKEDLVRAQSSLFTDAKAGNPQALEFFEKTFGLKVAPAGQAAAQTDLGKQQSTESKPGMFRVNRDAFIDPESADQVNSVLEAMDSRLAQAENAAKAFQTERENIQKNAAHESAKHRVIDEMVQVGNDIPAIRAISGLREAIAAWYDGKQDPRLEAFQELFDIAKENSTNLRAAFLIKRGKEADLSVAKARKEGLRDAYSQKPNPSLSGAQGGKSEGKYQPLTETQIEAMEYDHTLMPKSWFDKDDNPVLAKIPKNAHRLFA